MLKALGTLLYALGLELFTVEEATVDAPAAIVTLAQARWEAKQAKDWAKADQVRDALLAEGWVVKDKKDGFDLEAQ
jgi:cysteinyl-tRNA synthetase